MQATHHSNMPMSSHQVPVSSSAMSNTLPAQRDESEYPYVRFWNLDTWKNWSRGVKGVSKIEDPEEKGSRLSSYLEDENGGRVSRARQDAMFLHARSIWTQFDSAGQAPTSYKSAGISILNQFHSEMETNFAKLQLCSNHWKADRIWINNYPSWIENIIKKKNSTSCSKKRKSHNHAPAADPITLSSDEDSDDNINQPALKKSKPVSLGKAVTDAVKQDLPSLGRPKPHKLKVLQVSKCYAPP